jgi:uncharacterized protein DUF4238
MGTPKRHHYLPLFYLEKFSRRGLLWVYDQYSNEFRRQPPKDTAVETHRYSFLDEHGRLDASMEALLSRFETEAAPALAKLETGQPISTDDRCAIAAFVALLSTRVPETDRLSVKIDEYLRVRYQDLLDKTPPTTGEEDAPITFDPPYGGTVLISRQKMENYVKRFEEGGLDKKARLGEMLEVARGLSAIFVNLDWIVCHPPAEKAFVCTDSPLVTSPPPGWEPRGKKTFGPGTPGTKKLVPLSASAGLFMYDKGGRLAHRTIYDAQLRQSNIALASLCDRFVIGQDEAQLRSLVRASTTAV